MSKKPFLFRSFLVLKFFSHFGRSSPSRETDIEVLKNRIYFLNDGNPKPIQPPRPNYSFIYAGLKKNIRYLIA